MDWAPVLHNQYRLLNKNIVKKTFVFQKIKPINLNKNMTAREIYFLLIEISFIYNSVGKDWKEILKFIQNADPNY